MQSRCGVCNVCGLGVCVCNVCGLGAVYVMCVV